MRGDYASARSLYEQSLEVRGKGGPGATTLINLGLVAFAEKEYEKAGRRFEESLELCRATGYRLGIALCLAGLAGVHAMGGERERAARLLGAAEADLTKTGDVIQPGDQADYERFVAAARAGLDEASFKRAWAEGARLSLEQAIELAFEKGPVDA
jgi:tetratricopeptide (TPR) repeat protein